MANNVLPAGQVGSQSRKALSLDQRSFEYVSKRAASGTPLSCYSGGEDTTIESGLSNEVEVGLVSSVQ